jgi:anti-sigma factor ChrR (cupin superfamily)
MNHPIGGVVSKKREDTAMVNQPMDRSQTFVDRSAQSWVPIHYLPGVELSPLAQPVPDGSIHRARLAKGTVIPVHAHPADEYVLVLSGTVETGGRRCESGTFWTTPAGTHQGPHVALSDAELLTVRLGAMGQFGERT